MRSWVFRNRRRLEMIYGASGRARPLTVADPPREPASLRARAGAALPTGRLVLYELIPVPRRPLRSAG